ncbi:hypothetical protein PVAG01_03460 [Phlyctema vagabunda]|uniref:Uncharacterized protein n=1 Tax=Phlyctema vagabunda TaxID=108571 RepID=A0ABR4PLR4_9HELO
MSNTTALLQDCQIVGDADLYGLGVRVAVYAQAIVYLALASNRSTPRMALEVPSLITVLLILSVLVIRAIQGRLRPFDTMLALFSVGSLGSVAPLEEKAVIAARKKSLSGRIMHYAYNLSMAVQLLFGIWAVMNNLTLGPGQEHCRVWIYVFAKQTNQGWGMWMWKAYYWFVFVMLALKWLMENWSLIRPWILVALPKKKKKKETKANVKPKPDPSKSLHGQVDIKTKVDHQAAGAKVTAPPPLTKPSAAVISSDRGDPRESPRPMPTLTPLAPLELLPVKPKPDFLILASSFFWMVGFNIIGGELMIYWNRVQNVNSLDASGQTMALLAGVCTLVQFGWQLAGLSSA